VVPPGTCSSLWEEQGQRPLNGTSRPGFGGAGMMPTGYLSLTSNRYTDVKRLADCRVTRLTNGDDTDRAYLSDGEADVRVRNQAWDFEEVGRSLQLTAAPIYEAFKLKQASVMFLGSLKCEPEVPTAWNQLLAEETRNLLTVILPRTFYGARIPGTIPFRDSGRSRKAKPGQSLSRSLRECLSER